MADTRAYFTSHFIAVSCPFASEQAAKLRELPGTWHEHPTAESFAVEIAQRNLTECFYTETGHCAVIPPRELLNPSIEDPTTNHIWRTFAVLFTVVTLSLLALGVVALALGWKPS